MQEVVSVPLMVTGGFRTKAAMEYALELGGADLIGLGRPLRWRQTDPGRHNGRFVQIRG